MTNNNSGFSYEEYCRIVGDLFLNLQAQRLQAQKIIDDMKQQVAGLQKENRQLKEQCNTQNENIS